MIIVIILIMNDNQGCDGSDRVGKVGPASLPSEEEESGKKEGGCVEDLRVARIDTRMSGRSSGRIDKTMSGRINGRIFRAISFGIGARIPVGINTRISFWISIRIGGKTIFVGCSKRRIGCQIRIRINKEPASGSGSVGKPVAGLKI